MNEGSRTTPTVQLSAFSLFSDGLPAIAWVNERLSDNELKFAGRPTAAQLAARVAGSGPLSRFDWSHGSVAKPKKSLDGLNASVMAGARIERVKLPRIVMSEIGFTRPPTDQVNSPPAIEYSPPRPAASRSSRLITAPVDRLLRSARTSPESYCVFNLPT